MTNEGEGHHDLITPTFQRHLEIRECSSFKKNVHVKPERRRAGSIKRRPRTQYGFTIISEALFCCKISQCLKFQEAGGMLVCGPKYWV